MKLNMIKHSYFPKCVVLLLAVVISAAESGQASMVEGTQEEHFMEARDASFFNPGMVLVQRTKSYDVGFRINGDKELTHLEITNRDSGQEIVHALDHRYALPQFSLNRRNNIAGVGGNPEEIDDIPIVYLDEDRIVFPGKEPINLLIDSLFKDKTRDGEQVVAGNVR